MLSRPSISLGLGLRDWLAISPDRGLSHNLRSRTPSTPARDFISFQQHPPPPRLLASYSSLLSVNISLTAVMSGFGRKPEFCAGCERHFTISGFKSHLTQTKKPACIAVRNARTRNAASPSPPADMVPPSTPASLGDVADGVDDNLDPVPFGGDYFGDYSADDFDNYDEYDLDAGLAEHSSDDEAQYHQERLEEEDDEDSDTSNLEAETGWEPPPPDRQPSESTDGPQEQDTVNSEGGAPNRDAQARAYQHLRSKTFVIPFPGNRAGAPITRRRERSAYEDYQARIDAVNANPYAPFISKMDWELAKWAKNRGPGSTAVSELLQIENVSGREPWQAC